MTAPRAQRPPLLAALALLAATVAVLCAPSARATHLQSGQLYWTQTGALQITATAQIGLRMTRVAQAGTVCSAVGGTMTWTSGLSIYDFYQATGCVGTATSYTTMVCDAIFSGSDTAVGTKSMVLNYASTTKTSGCNTGPWVMRFFSSTLDGDLNNNANGDMYLLSPITLGLCSGSPRGFLPPVISLVRGDPWSLRIPAFDPSNLDISFSMATAAEMGNVPDPSPYWLEIDQSTGLLQANWTGATPNTGKWIGQVLVKTSCTRSPIQTLFKLLSSNRACHPSCTNAGTACTSSSSCTGCPGTLTAAQICYTNVPPRYVSPNASVACAAVGSPFTPLLFNATDDNSNLALQIVISSVPSGSSFSALSGTNPVTSTFTWTPTTGQDGFFMVCQYAFDPLLTVAVKCVSLFVGTAIASLSSVTTTISPSQTHYRDPSYVTVVGAGFRQLAEPECRIDYASGSTTIGTFLTSSRVLCQIPTTVLPGYHVIDVSNGCSQWANASVWFVTGAPNVTSFTPAMPLETANVTINVDYISPQGNSFQCRFSFGSGSSASASTPATIVNATHVTTTQVRCTVPRIPSGTVSISVATGLGGGFGTSKSYDFPVPELDTPLLAPQPIAMSNGSWIVLPAINATASPRLACVATASAGNVSSLAAVYLNTSALRCWVPTSMVAGSYVLRITNDGWNASATSVAICVACDLLCPATPSASAVSPSRAFYNSSMTITVTGSLFQNSSTLGCRIGSRSLTTVFVNSTRVICNGDVNNGTGWLNVTLTNGCSAWTSPALEFFAFGKPVPVSAAPTILTREAVNRIVASGRWFFNGTGLLCVLGNTTAAQTEFLNETHVACTFAAGTLGAGANALFVRNDAATGFAQWLLQLQVYATGVVSSDTSALSGGSTVTITGRTLSPSANVSDVVCVFNGNVTSPAVSIDIATGTVTCITPSFPNAGAITLQITGDGGLNSTYAVQYFAEVPITTVSPVTMPAVGGTNITLVGMFDPSEHAVCDIDGQLVPAVVHTKTIASCIAPPHAIGYAALRFGNHGVVQPGSVSVRLTFYASVSPRNGTTRGGDSITVRGWFGATNASRYFVRIAKDKVMDALWLSSYELTFKTPAYPTGEATVEVSSAVTDAARSLLADCGGDPSGACEAAATATAAASSTDPSDPTASSTDPSDPTASSSDPSDPTATASSPADRAATIEWFVVDAPFRFIEPGRLPRTIVNALDPSRTLQIFDREASSANATCLFDGAVLQAAEVVAPSTRPGTSSELDCDVPASLSDGWHTLVVLDDGIPTTFSFLVLNVALMSCNVTSIDIDEDNAWSLGCNVTDPFVSVPATDAPSDRYAMEVCLTCRRCTAHAANATLRAGVAAELMPSSSWSWRYAAAAFPTQVDRTYCAWTLAGVTAAEAQHGAVVTFDVTPEADYYGSDWLEVSVRKIEHASDVRVYRDVTVTIAPVNDPPFASIPTLPASWDLQGDASSGADNPFDEAAQPLPLDLSGAWPLALVSPGPYEWTQRVSARVARVECLRASDGTTALDRSGLWETAPRVNASLYLELEFDYDGVMAAGSMILNVDVEIADDGADPASVAFSRAPRAAAALRTVSLAISVVVPERPFPPIYIAISVITPLLVVIFVVVAILFRLRFRLRRRKLIREMRADGVDDAAADALLTADAIGTHGRRARRPHKRAGVTPGFVALRTMDHDDEAAGARADDSDDDDDLSDVAAWEARRRLLNAANESMRLAAAAASAPAVAVTLAPPSPGPAAFTATDDDDDDDDDDDSEHRMLRSLLRSARPSPASRAAALDDPPSEVSLSDGESKRALMRVLLRHAVHSTTPPPPPPTDAPVPMSVLLAASRSSSEAGAAPELRTPARAPPHSSSSSSSSASPRPRHAAASRAAPRHSSSSPSMPSRNGQPPSPLVAAGETPLLTSASRLSGSRSSQSVSDGARAPAPPTPPSFHASLQRRLQSSSTLSFPSHDASAPMFAFAPSLSSASSSSRELLGVPPPRDLATTPSAVSIHSAAPAALPPRDVFDRVLDSRPARDGDYRGDDDGGESRDSDGDRFDETASGSSGSSHLADVFRSHSHPFGSGR